MRRSLPNHHPLVLRILFGCVLLLGLVACQPQQGLPAPRTLVNTEGVRLNPDRARMAEIDEWVQQQSLDIQNDPEFWIISDPITEERYPWEALEIDADTAVVHWARTAPDALDEYLPEAIGTEGLAFELAVLDRVADAWLYGRSVFDLIPYQPLDEIMYANEAGWLKALVLTARAGEFPDERRTWLDEDPGAASAYREWFRATFDMEPPGIR